MKWLLARKQFEFWPWLSGERQRYLCLAALLQPPPPLPHRLLPLGQKPLSSKYGTCNTVETRLRPWLEPLLKRKSLKPCTMVPLGSKAVRRVPLPCGPPPTPSAAPSLPLPSAPGNSSPAHVPPLPPSAPRVQGSGFRVQCSGFRVQGSGFRVQGSGRSCRFQGTRKLFARPCPPSSSFRP
jgi:hypothetical protein